MPLVVSSDLQSSGSTFVARCALVSWSIVFSGIVTRSSRSWFYLETDLCFCPVTVVENITALTSGQKESERDAGSPGKEGEENFSSYRVWTYLQALVLSCIERFQRYGRPG
jgi:hypothetical protein